jgi:hypothetical protein
MNNRGLWSLALLVAAALLGSYGYQRTFHGGNLISALEEAERGTKVSLQEEELFAVQAMVSQPFYYLGEGNQVYAFVSSDGQYVLKFFKFGHLKPGCWGEWCFFLRNRERRKERKRQRLFRAYNIAFNRDRDHTGLIYLHVYHSDGLFPAVALIDRYGFRHRIDLNKICFALQKKSIPLREVIGNALDRGDVATAKSRLQQVLEMYIAEYQLGICDEDHNLWYNVGFCGERPMRLDVGKLSFDLNYADPIRYRSDLAKVINLRIAGWLQRHYPHYHLEIIACLEGWAANHGCE